MQLGHKRRYLAEWTCTITCSVLLICGALFWQFGQFVMEILKHQMENSLFGRNCPWNR